MLLDDTAADGQAQARASFLARDEGFEHPFQDVLCDPAAGVGNRDVAAAIREGGVLYSDAQFAAVGHGFDAVEQQIDEHLMQLSGIAFHQDRHVAEVLANDDIRLPSMALDQVEGPSQGVAQVMTHSVHLRWPGIVQQPLDRLLHADDLFLDGAQLLGTQGAVGGTLGGGLDQQLDPRERIAEFVSHAGSQLPDRGQPVGGECLPTGLLEFFDHLLDPGRHQLHLLLQLRQIVRRTYFDATNLVLQAVCRILQVDANLRHRAVEPTGNSHPVQDAHGWPRQEQRHQGEVEHGSQATPLGGRLGDEKLVDLQQALTGGGDFVG